MKMTKITLYVGLVFGATAFGSMADSEFNSLGISKDVAQRSWFNQSASYRFNNSPALPASVGINKNAGAFIITDDEGSFQRVEVFGDGEYGGVLPPSVDDFLTLIQPDKMYASGNALLAYSSLSKMAIAWGHGVVARGDVNTLSHVATIYPGADSFILISDSRAPSVPYVREYTPHTGEILAVEGITSEDPVTAVYHTGGDIGKPLAWLAVKNSGEIAVWGDPEAGGRMSEAAQVALDGAVVKEVYTTNDAFLVRTSDNHWVAWDGNPEDTSGAGDITELASLLLKMPGAIVQATKSAFAVSSSVGVTAWGEASCGGVLDNAASEVVNMMQNPELYATSCSFIAVDITEAGKGKVAQWGDNNFVDSADNVGQFGVLTTNNGAVIYDVLDSSGQVLWSLNSAALSETASNTFNITQIEEMVASADAYAFIGRLGANHMLVSWAEAESFLDATITCPTKPQIYSTQSSLNYDTGYFLSYHPNCGESDVTTWASTHFHPSDEYHFQYKALTIKPNETVHNSLSNQDDIPITPQKCTSTNSFVGDANVDKGGCVFTAFGIGDTRIRAYVNDKPVAESTIYVR